jgi:hypothetical protein
LEVSITRFFWASYRRYIDLVARSAAGLREKVEAHERSTRSHNDTEPATQSSGNLQPPTFCTARVETRTYLVAPANMIAVFNGGAKGNVQIDRN